VGTARLAADGACLVSSAAEILAELGEKARTRSRGLAANDLVMTRSRPGEAVMDARAAGTRLARMLEAEFGKRLTRWCGEWYERIRPPVVSPTGTTFERSGTTEE
jgi:hypothetical protein